MQKGNTSHIIRPPQPQSGRIHGFMLFVPKSDPNHQRPQQKPRPARQSLTVLFGKSFAVPASYFCAWPGTAKPILLLQSIHFRAGCVVYAVIKRSYLYDLSAPISLRSSFASFPSTVLLFMLLHRSD